MSDLVRNHKDRTRSPLISPIIYKANLLFSSPEPKAHMGELIGYRCSSIRTYVVANNFKHLLLQNPLPNQSQILGGASLVRGMKVCLRHLGHMTKMAPTPTYGKNPSKNLLRNRRIDLHKTWYVASGTPAHHSLFK